MSKRYKLSAECRSNETRQKAASLGYANMIMFLCKRSSMFKMQTLNFWLIPAIDHQQIAFFFDRAGKPVGYVIWAHLAPDVEQRLLNDADFLLHPSEWNEGGRTWIIDFCFPAGGAKDCISQLKETFREASIPRVLWIRRKNDTAIKKTGRRTLGALNR